ncbi:hypothetical protein [Christiangramia salexigens]|uniref:Uncharacterized protein n=1 Tax=Christiangramia salexigens TaxID=1913577 RepID=A0A1L3J434_9FLAO|nr:hypothetical protein [Christiangramia salexigens]APG59870.1 hypothetical protein LPB144_05330 [Christiangramia salexigens]
MKNKSILLSILIAIISVLISCEPTPPEKAPEVISEEKETPVVEEEEEEEEETEEEETPVIEYLDFPDPNFKHALVNTKCIDVDNDRIGDMDMDSNDDGEIDKSEAEFIENLILQFNYWDIKRTVDITGIENFKDLRSLIITSGESEGFIESTKTEPISYNLTILTQLEFLRITELGTEFFDSIDLTGLSSLVEADLWGNRPSFLSDSREWEDPIYFTELKLTGCSSLKQLRIMNSFFIVDFCQVPTLEKLNMRYLEAGEPEVFDFHCLTRLKWLDISENTIESLILKNTSVLETFEVSYIGSEADHSNYPFVKYICIDDIPEEYEQITTLIDQNTVVTTDCTF